MGVSIKRIRRIVMALVVFMLIGIGQAAVHAAGTDFGNAQEFVLGNSAAGSWSDTQKKQTYRFSMTYGGNVKFSIESDKVTGADITVYNEKKEKVFAKKGKNVFFNLAKGNYYLFVEAAASSECEYSLKSEVAYASGSCGNNSFSTAAPITIGKTIEGNLPAGQPKFYYKFTLEKGGKLDFKISSETVKAITVTFYDGNQKALSVPPTRTFSSTTYNLAKGQYYMVVYSKSYFGNFSLQSKQTPAAGSVGNSTATKAVSLTNHQSIVGNISANQDISYFKIYAPTAGELKVKLSSSTVKTATIALCNSIGKRVQTKNGVSSAAFMVQSGTHYIQIARGSYYGNYTLTVDAPNVPSQKITVSCTKTYKYSALKKKAKTFRLKAKTTGNGKLTYEIIKYPKNGQNYIKVTAKGKVTLKKKAPKGKYRIRIRASATAKYLAASKVITIRVK